MNENALGQWHVKPKGQSNEYVLTGMTPPLCHRYAIRT